MRGEATQVNPVEPFRRVFQQRFRRLLFRLALFAERVVRAHMLAAHSHRLLSPHTRHVNGHHMLVTIATI